MLETFHSMKMAAADDTVGDHYVNYADDYVLANILSPEW